MCLLVLLNNVKLKEEILVYESTSFRSIEEVYRMIYNEYKIMKKENPAAL